MDKREIKELIKELFRQGEIKIELQQENYNELLSSDYSKVFAQIIIDDEIIQETGKVYVKSYD